MRKRQWMLKLKKIMIFKIVERYNENDYIILGYLVLRQRKDNWNQQNSPTTNNWLPVVINRLINIERQFTVSLKEDIVFKKIEVTSKKNANNSPYVNELNP